ncbi:hypothetical protein Poli38472_002762 [Pythium oligandrum]|uniref:ribonucleoside-triphosphate reductase (thioredoxin) n=1 Tax=Pythium oligandrum TaxID=41045 RepID=A0A8K1CJE6_PYTOL|nr:hypothetical protein Poli38472_002762 [Pythium oligandrum]|eukprot:TMW63821.1 hypothetical protein Poli38472_002762 [Pythium oligandrum]
MVTVKSQTKVALKSTTPSLRSSTSAMRKKNRTPRRPRPTRLTGTARQHHIQTPSKVKGSTRKIDFHELMRFHNRYVNEDVSPIANTPPTASLKSVSAANEPAQYETKVAKVAIQDTTNYLEAANIDTLSATSYKLNQVVNDNKQFKTPASDLIPIPNPVAPDDIELPMAWSEMSQRSRERFKRALAAIRNRYRCRCQPNGREHQRGRNQDAAKHPVGSIQCRLHRRVADAALMTSDEIFFQSFGPPEQLLQVQNPFSRENMPEVALRLAAIDAETEAEATALRPVVKSQLPTPTHWTHSSISSRSKRVSVLTKSSTARTNTSAAVATRVGQTPFIKGAKLTPTKVNSSVSAPSVTTPKTTTVTTGFEAVKTLSITKKAIKTNIRQVTTKKAIVRPSAVATIKPSQADRMLLQQTKTLTNRSLLLDMEIAKVLRKTMVHSKQVMALEQTIIGIPSQKSHGKRATRSFPPTKGFFRQYSSLSNSHEGFQLDPSFVASFRARQPPFGFNGLGELVYMRTYSRVRPDDTKERWHETVERVVNGTFSMQKRWLRHLELEWDTNEMQGEARNMYERIFAMKFLPPGRGLWAMGSAITEERGLFAALNNCAFVSTEDLKTLPSPAEPFCFLMDAAMLGVGVGFDTKGAGQIVIRRCNQTEMAPFQVPDSREGWVESVERLLNAHFLHHPKPVFDYSLIRPAGKPIRGFGGVSSGAGPLIELHKRIDELLGAQENKVLTARGIVDIMNNIGVCVVSGNVRRTAEIAFGDYRDTEYVELKDYTKNPDRMAYGWTSNNSIFADLGMDYAPITQRIVQNGEPGFAWLENMRNFGRMNGVVDLRDHRASGGNPCLEQTLESYEMCCLVETFPANHVSLDDYLETLRYAYLYAKTVTLGQTHWPRTNRVMLRNRRIGCSMSGIAQFITHNGIDELRQWCESGYDAVHEYDEVFSERFAIPRSIKTTSIKPSGTVSLLAGATPGMHYPESRFYIRRMRLDKASELVSALRDAGYDLEPAVESPEMTLVVSIPVDVGEGIRTIQDISAWEQLSLAAFLQRHWADNQVSCTVTFDPEREGEQLAPALDYFQYQLKGVSLLPRLAMGAYAQMPYESIDEATYHEKLSRLKPLRFDTSLHVDANAVQDVPDQFCEACEVPKV